MSPKPQIKAIKKKAPETAEGVAPTIEKEKESDVIVVSQARFFQAVGNLHGRVEKKGNGMFIRLEEILFPLYFAKSCYASFMKWFEQEANVPVYLMVYPKIRAVSNEPQIISFHVLRWSEKSNGEEDGQFKLRGIWQSIREDNSTVISVYRNVGSVDPSGRFKAAHIPVAMKREDGVLAFRYQAKLSKEEQSPRWFIEGIFQFAPTEGEWSWISDLESPTREIPEYEKPNKNGIEEAKKERHSPKKGGKEQRKDARSKEGKEQKKDAQSKEEKGGDFNLPFEKIRHWEEAFEKAKQVYEQVEELNCELEKMEIMGLSSNGLVAVIVNGKQEPRKVRIERDALREGVERVSSAIREAMQDAYAKSLEIMQKKMQEMGEGIGLSFVSAFF